MTVLAYISDSTVLGKILGHVGLPTTSPPLAPPRGPAQAALFEDDAAADGAASHWSHNRSPRVPRGPPPDDDESFDPSVDNDWGA